MKKFKLKINWENTIEADTEEEAIEIFWNNMFGNNESAETFLSDIIDIEETK